MNRKAIEGRFRVVASPSLEGWPTVDEVAALGGYCFQGREFLEVWLETIGAARGIEPFLVRVEDGPGRPVMQVCLGVERSEGLRRLVFLDGGVVDYNVPIIHEAGNSITSREMGEIWSGFLRLAPPFDLAALEKTPRLLGGTDNPLGLLGSMPDLLSGHTLGLNGTWEQYKSKAMPRRQDSRRKRRQLAEIGPVRLEIAGSDFEARDFLSCMVLQKTRRYLETTGEDQFTRPGYSAYFPAMTERLRSTGLVQVAAVMVGDAIIATHWGMVACGRFHYLMPAFEGDEWRRFSPGRILIEELIAWSFRAGLHSFDFGPGDEPFKDEFADSVVPLIRIERPASLKGRVRHGIVQGRRALAASPTGPSLKTARDWIRSRRKES